MELKILFSVLLWVVSLEIYSCQDKDIPYNDTEGHLRKRLTIGTEVAWKRWPNGVVPYCYDAALPASRYPIYTAAMDAYSKHSCISFKHFGCAYLSGGGINLKSGGAGYAYYGRQWNLKGTILGSEYQMIAHELYHVIGGYHEQQNYKSIATAQLMYKNIMPYYRKQFVPVYSEKDNIVDHEVITYHFDFASPTLYSRYLPSVTGFPVYDVMYPDQYFTDEKRVFLDQISEEINEFYNCWELKSCGTKPICDNEGYPGYYNRQCGCVCPRGLDSASNCAAIKTKPSGSWPDTDIKLLKTTSGCPAGLKESTVVVTGVTAMTKSSNYNLATALSGDTLTVYLCSKPSAGNTEVWDHGMNGFLAGNNQCPSAIESGDIKFYAADGSSAGSLDFCVQQGLVEEPLMGLPTTDEFAVFSRASTCQEIDGFVANRESFTISHPNITDMPALPKYSKKLKNGKFDLKLDYCVYKPLTYNCGGVIKLDSTNRFTVISSPNYPAAYPQNTECNWFIEVEHDATIRAEFKAFDVNAADSFTHRRYILNAIPVKLSSGSALPRNVVSINNRLAFNFRSGFVGTPGTGFQINITRLGAEDYCYSLSDKGESYDGNWNYAIDGTKCLPWSLRLNQNLTSSGYADYTGSTSTFLTGSACRNPQGKLDKPACLTFAKGGNFTVRYCDVCQIEYGTQDIYDDCETAIAAEPSICTGSTAGKCLETCELNGLIPLILPPPTVDEQTCPTPPIPSDATQTSETVKSTYHPGDTVRLQCMDSDKDVSVTCMTSGKWSEWNEPCKGCPPGFAEISDKCWKPIGRLDHRFDAKAHCVNNYNGTLMTIRTIEEHEFFYEWRKTLGAEKEWWIGAADWDQNGFKYDDDQTLMSSYETGDQFELPKDARYSKNCVIHGIWEKWHSSKCMRTSQYMCEKPLAGSPVTCKDRKRECITLLRENPMACTDPVVKTNVCPYTCGAEVCMTSGNECSNLQTPANAAMVEAKTSLGPGEFVQYTCDPGYDLQSGSLTRACLRNGQLTGCPPVCVASGNAVISVNDFPMGMFRSITPIGIVFMGESQQFKVTRNGKIYSWQVYCANNGEVYMQVWRKQSGMTYKLIGQTIVQCYAGLSRDITLNSTARIPVQSGDVLGFFDSTGGTLTYYSCRNNLMPEFANIHVYAAWPSAMVVSADITFVSNQCKMFAVNAKIGP
ncbi:uncharacterized protein LOC121381388 [Gigantopelta aegis]|uniref:uncharacterized protein LOC121381388 n=1 Tax=Gigantopelta aegis TaxID=1735272 RepID=UPI001B88E404|nr:uncharacterized protein LOC121381388 [Gigantopelta aegis]